MKKVMLVVSVLAVWLTTALANPAFEELSKLAQAGVDEGVVSAYIADYPEAISLTAEQVVYLKDLGLSQELISEALRHQAPSGPESAPPAPEPAAVAPQPPAASQPVTLSMFYQELKPYGTWLSIGGEWCWQPNAAAVDPEWKPYGTAGHWAYTDCGWAWVSSYSWGWAPFHYGRWARDPARGWYWVPDVEWGPAWVVWRTNHDYFGWAPLPPKTRFVAGAGIYFHDAPVAVNFDFGLREDDFCFVASRHFGEEDLWRYHEPVTRVRVVYHQTSLTREYELNKERRIVNHGPSIEIVAAVTKRPVARLTIVDAVEPHGQPARGEANRLAFYRPVVSRTAPQTPLQVQAARPHGVEERPVRTDADVRLSNERQVRAAQVASKKYRADMAESDMQEAKIRKQAETEKDADRLVHLKLAAEEQHERSQQSRVKAEKAEKLLHDSGRPDTMEHAKEQPKPHEHQN